MPNVLIDKNKIDILANAIAAKSGEPLKLTLEEMVEAVDGIETGGGGVTPTGNIDITQAGVTDVTNYATATVPAAGWEGLQYIDVYPGIEVSSNGNINAGNGTSISIGPITSNGWITTEDGITLGVYGQSSYQLPTQAATTITPTTSQQIAVTSGKYTTGNIIVDPIPYADGDNEAYGTTSEIWLINATPTTTGSGMITYSIDFISNNTTNNEIQLLAGPFSAISYSSVGTVYNSFSGGWTNQAYRTIELTGGADKDNANWRAWLEANAVKQ